MKKWLVTMMKRIGELLAELVSVKFLVFAIIVAVYFKSGVSYGLAGFIVFAILAMSFIGVRFAEKRLHLLAAAKELAGKVG